jgi:hypothetical protein
MIQIYESYELKIYFSHSFPHPTLSQSHSLLFLSFAMGSVTHMMLPLAYVHHSLPAPSLGLPLVTALTLLLFAYNLIERY